MKIYQVGDLNNKNNVKTKGEMVDTNLVMMMTLWMMLKNSSLFKKETLMKMGIVCDSI